MKIGIVGLPASGKTTLFRALVPDIEQVDYERPNVGSAKIKDKNIDELADFFKPKKKTYAEITFVDIPGVSSGEENKKRRIELLSHIRRVDALVQVVNGFLSENLEEQIAVFDSDLIISDMDIIERRLEKLTKEKPDSQKEAEKKALKKCLEAVNSEKPIRNIDLSREEKHALSSFEFLTLKPMIYLINISDTILSERSKITEALRARHPFKNTDFLCVPLKLEQEIAELSEEEKKEFLESYGLNEPVLPELIEITTKLLNLNVFYTVGEDEVRAWLFEQGLNARATAGKIHSDIERGFIAAEVISFENFKACGFSFKEAKAKGLLRIEGEDYEVKDKEIVHFRFNV